MAQRQVKVTGPPAFGPDVPCRLAIKDLVKDKHQFSLYIQAIRLMQEKQWNAADQLSYWQLASLHGLPTQDSSGNTYVWDTVKKDNGFWCAHSRPTFPTWHRPYVSLYEQALVNAAVEIVEKSPSPVDPVWTQAAKSLRAPYWDWAIDAYPPDEVIAETELTILGLDNKPLTIKNPLYSFTYPTGSINIEQSPKTVRHPNSAGETDVEEVRKALRTTFKPPLGDTMQERIYKLHRDANEWETVSNDGGTSDNIKFRNGLEQPHGQIHVALGGAGAMGSVPTAGFDPAFMLHHSQVDRQLALWQTYHYDKWIPAAPGATSLTPFWDGKQEFNSSGIRAFKAFQYSYPEFVGIPADPVEASKFIWKKIEQLYNPPQSASEPAAAAGASPLEWFAHVRIPIKSIVQSFYIYFFAGAPPANSRDWQEADNLIGIYAKFAGSDPAHCANCRNLIAEGVESHAAVTLTPALKITQKYGGSEEQVEQYLRKNLEWRVMKNDGTVVDPGKVEGLQISVLTQKLARPRGGGHMPAFPDPDEGPVYHNITGGKPGGRPDA